MFKKVINLYCNVLSELNIRIIGSFLSSFIFSFFMIPKFINFVRRRNIKYAIRKYIPLKKKNNIPSMGGIINVFVIISTSLIWIKSLDSYIFYVLCTLLGYASIGFIDDIKKIFHKNHYGLSIIHKYLLQSLITIIILFIIYLKEKEIFTFINIGSFHYEINEIACFIFFYFIIVGFSNSVNLTDGLDGLAVFPTILVILGFFISYIKNYTFFSQFYQLEHQFSKELIIVFSTIIGSNIGFLWFNAYPAKIFMGDIGSLSLGSLIGIISILIKKEYLLFIIGIPFILEAFSVIIQIIFFKITKKKYFLMSPIHHHFELKGHQEPEIIIKFWIISITFFILGILIDCYV